MKEPKTTATRQFACFALARINENDLEALRTRLKEIDVQTTAVMRGQNLEQVDLSAGYFKWDFLSMKSENFPIYII